MQLHTAIDKHIAVDANDNEIAAYLYEILDRIERESKTPELLSAMHLMYGRLLLCRKQFDKAYLEFRESSTLCVENGLLEFVEILFWMGKMAEVQQDYATARSRYQSALKECRDNPIFVSSDDILDAMNNLEKV